MRGKIEESKEIVLKSDTFFHLEGRLRAQSLFNSLRVDLQVRNFKKKDNLGCDVQLSIRRQHLQFSQNLCWKNAGKLLGHPSQMAF